MRQIKKQKSLKKTNREKDLDKLEINRKFFNFHSLFDTKN